MCAYACAGVCVPAEHSRNLHAVLRRTEACSSVGKERKVFVSVGEQSEGRKETIAVTQQSGAFDADKLGLLENIEAHMERLCHRGMPGPSVL